MHGRRTLEHVGSVVVDGSDRARKIDSRLTLPLSRLKAPAVRRGEERRARPPRPPSRQLAFLAGALRRSPSGRHERLSRHLEARRLSEAGE